MSWLLNLYETYESNLDRVGVAEKKNKDQEFTLLPISHTTQTAHIEVTVTEEGEFHSASIIDKSDASTLIPCTEDSSSRSGSKVAPYPLHDKLSYVAGDFKAYGGQVKKEDPFIEYIKQLGDWAASPYGHAKVKSIFNYLKKGQLIGDLVKHRILAVDENNLLIGKWHDKYSSLYGEKPKIFSVLSGGQESAFVRFNVSNSLKDVWKDQEMYESFIGFYNHKLGDEKLCYVTGNMLPSTEKHANKIRNAADKAKLISANDSSGFTYRGRFHDSKEVASISYDVSQKAHNALKWLIHRQGKIIDQRVFLVWANDAPVLPGPEEDAFSLGFGSLVKVEKKSFTNKEFANEVAKALDGYKNNLASSKSNVNLLILDSATTGRMAVLYYRNMDKELYFDRLTKWHTSCVWLHRYRKDQNGDYVQFYGAPATKDIAYAAYGPKANDKVVKGLMERMLPCIVDERKIPSDIIKSAFHRASNPVSMEKWEWEKTLSITCALINKEEGYEVALDKQIDDRSYLFGRMLAVADVLERRALGSEETRATNAIRYMNSFSQHPERTWRVIQASLQPYQARLGAKGYYLSSLIDEIASKLKCEDFNNKPLSGKYLLGFYSQRHELYQKKEKDTESNVSPDENSEHSN
ncbi:CRISPR-associated protein Cas8c/Csd1, subtype I-C/DVULG [Paenibacillus larvae subsp. larvae]|uniref:CRISPR-associated protein Cas8c/Csd1, subtype I-C/DVULG n=1 Tax=Paenibacillus larvae subsp. larvae TaxID=147375 RepID=A0A2L1U0F2_9BACL|nr:type I-C CRISPR-associated protein Cas8c/Csd1 [Paenibacillus larvae]AQT83281.1 type I-C CRISPR-associated protein Cas8c/Csd1 [Paenibacillus larvae subsp. pulvifaciens]AQZ48400.1 type I-C CRISPR-associated protein Cas8c/Csd1 [Paenibacillus larvae subsp. pulvifaciens]AVF26401.1 CRISPR-associated protein Cas8c/Csd1, subtype I-C/DVULG [Paenibacillus larvae subsp. larvae]AVF31178.1 CRISPR-associated protein Cas8c/Csd1, subtype I-C/DVULG [Paenibacillus larvae subsp. larvae]MBH0344372.1 CRISPR-ass